MCAKFVADAKAIHGDKFDYSNIEYVNNQTKVSIICPKHGTFNITPHAHKQGRGCKGCFLESLRDTQDSIISKFIAVHGDTYDYSLVDFKSRHEKVSIICKKHGVFQQTPLMHCRGHDCAKCANEARFGIKYDIKDFIDRYTQVHGSDYIFQSLERIGKRTILTAVCNKHGIFKQDASMALSGRGCKQCGLEKSNAAGAASAHDTGHFIGLSINKHGDTYDYSGVDYINCRTPVSIICKKHGAFLQTPSEHLRGSGCSSCGVVVSKWQSEISKLVNSEVIINDRKVINPYEIDIYVPEHKFGIECHGYYWHSYNEKETHAQKYKHYIKHELAVKAGIKLLQIYDFEYSNNVVLIKSMIKYHCRSSIGVYARKCKCIQLNSHEARQFFDSNHIQKHRPTNYYLGLMYDDKIVSCISLSIGDEFEIIRFANLCGHNVVGGFSKLLRHAIDTLKPKSIMTYADRRFSNGNLYSTNGFKLVKATEPGYKYVSSNGSVVLSRYQCQKNKLARFLKNYDAKKPEYQNMFDNGFRRLWDAGHYKFILNL